MSLPPRLRFVVLIVPVAWCALIMAFMRPDALKMRPEVAAIVGPLVYDETDLGALALRGANAHIGRMPGRPDEPGWNEPPQLAEQLDAPQPPYSDRFFLEYPIPALALFRLGFLIQPDAATLDLPPAVADSHHYAVAHFVPRTPAEARLWQAFRTAGRFYVVVMTAALVALIVLVGRGYERGAGWNPRVWLAVLPAAVYFSLNRFDIVPTLLVAVSFACLGRNRPGWAGAWLAAGVMFKVFPVLFVPIVLRYLGPARGARWLAGFAAALAVGFGASWALTDWDATVGPIRMQFARTLPEVGTSWTLYGRLLPEALGRSSTARIAVLATVALALVATRPADLAGVLRRCGILLVAFVVMAVFWSPQWVVWFLPLLIPLARTSRCVAAAAAALDVVNYVSFSILFLIVYSMIDVDTAASLAGVMHYVRGVAWFGLAGVLAWGEWAARRSARRPTHDEGIAVFRRDRAALTALFLERGRAAGTPRGLAWVSAVANGEPVFASDETGRLVALAPLVVQFAPEPGSDLEDVPQAREPRPVTGMFTWENGAWRTTGRAVFNLSPEQVIANAKQLKVKS
ncbi:glycosyltransferase family 87 protein [Fimbriiglobus ruber]|uniref:Putative integral membrane protein n=1 Tax=Fimbriiglobus ruber TaxID=1908690 RepID=A0A225E3U7_9BACT|nr:glycosyltransferase family 87 protein [Fimbriiglobus ruber]OWK45468.1 putative integral membrane protein [Fimbriiglobus ruber]